MLKLKQELAENMCCIIHFKVISSCFLSFQNVEGMKLIKYKTVPFIN
jgi:hypothetical protein